MKELEAQWELFPEIPRTSAQVREGRWGRYSGGLGRASVAVPKEKNLAKKREYTKPCSSKPVTQRDPLKALHGGEKRSASASSKRARTAGGGRSQGSGAPFFQSHDLSLGAHVTWVT